LEPGATDWRSRRGSGQILVVDVAVDDPVAALRGATGRLAASSSTSPQRRPAAFAQAIELARPAGTVASRGPRVGYRRTGFHADMVVLKNADRRRPGVDATAYRAALDVLVSGRYPFADLPRRCVGLDDAGDLLATMAGERTTCRQCTGVTP